MKNITLAVDEAVLDEARIYAAKRNTTVNALVRDFLKDLVREEERLADTQRRLKNLIDNSTGEIGPDYVWNRDEIYEERMFPRHKRADLRGGGTKA